MKRCWVSLLCVVLLTISANAQAPAGTADAHVAAAKAAARQDYSGVINLCKSATTGGGHGDHYLGSKFLQDRSEEIAVRNFGRILECR